MVSRCETIENQRRSVTEIKTFEDLEVWKSCRRLRQKIFTITQNYPTQEERRLVNQLRRAAISTTANIAEGYGSFHYQENIQYCRQSRGSLYEILDHLITSLDQEYISKECFENLKHEFVTSIKLLNGYLRMLQRSKANHVV